METLIIPTLPDFFYWFDVFSQLDPAKYKQHEANCETMRAGFAKTPGEWRAAKNYEFQRDVTKRLMRGEGLQSAIISSF